MRRRQWTELLTVWILLCSFNEDFILANLQHLNEPEALICPSSTLIRRQILHHTLRWAARHCANTEEIRSRCGVCVCVVQDSARQLMTFSISSAFLCLAATLTPRPFSHISRVAELSVDSCRGDAETEEPWGGDDKAGEPGAKGPRRNLSAGGSLPGLGPN